MAGLFVLVQYALPRHWLTALVYRLARVRSATVKNFLIRRFVAAYDVDVDEVALPVPDGFATFNAFFVRELAAGERPLDDRADSIVSPVDGTVSLAGRIRGDRLLQAKGHEYTVAELLATDIDEAARYDDGRFATIYLAPYNYHRVHAPLAGQLRTARYIPGDLFSVNEATVSRLPGLFRRNERLVMHFDGADGPFALLFVGALNVGSISTPWSGELRPQKRGIVETLDLGEHPRDVARGDLLGWFNMGSTVILLLPPGTGGWDSRLVSGARLRMGEAIGRRSIGDG